MRILFLFLMLGTAFNTLAQLPSVYQKKSKSRQLGEQARTATLVVVIENEKNEGDAALVDAVKKNWHIGPVKYMSQLEFIDKFKNNNFDRNQLYLFHNHINYLNIPTSVAPLYSGFYLCSDPVALLYSNSSTKKPAYLHFSANALFDRRYKASNGYFLLMIKNFDHDIRFCQDENNFSRKLKYKKKGGITYFVARDEIAAKTTLLVKEQVQRTIKKKTKKKKKNTKQKPMEYITDDFINKKKPVVVFPEDIEHAVKIQDPQIMLFTGGCLYSAETGATLATSRQKSNSTPRLVVSVVSTLVSVAGLVFILNK